MLYEVITNLAIYALPVMVAISAAQYAWGAGAGVLLVFILTSLGSILGTYLGAAEIISNLF